MLWDLHMHTNYSGDSDATPDSMVQRAIELGLSGICITDHEDLDYPEADLFTLDLKKYHQMVSSLQQNYKHQIPVLFGIELGLQPHLAIIHTELIAEYPFDFVIASSHLVHGCDPYYPDFYKNRSEKAAYTEYFESILENLQYFSDFDVYGHIDYVVRYGPNKNKNYSYRNYQDIIDAILIRLIDMGKGIELNTAGYKYGLGHPNPTEDILLRYRELGGEILTVGADGHKPEHIAYDFHKVPDLLKFCGFRYYTVFQNRTPVFYPL